MINRKEKNNRSFGSLENIRGENLEDSREKHKQRADENFESTDTDAAETDSRIKQASQASGNTIEEGDEDYDDEMDDSKE